MSPTHSWMKRSRQRPQGDGEYQNDIADCLCNANTNIKLNRQFKEMITSTAPPHKWALKPVWNIWVKLCVSSQKFTRYQPETTLHHNILTFVNIHQHYSHITIPKSTHFTWVHIVLWWKQSKTLIKEANVTESGVFHFLKWAPSNIVFVLRNRGQIHNFHINDKKKNYIKEIRSIPVYILNYESVYNTFKNQCNLSKSRVS